MCDSEETTTTNYLIFGAHPQPHPHTNTVYNANIISISHLGLNLYLVKKRAIIITIWTIKLTSYKNLKVWSPSFKMIFENWGAVGANPTQNIHSGGVVKHTPT